MRGIKQYQVSNVLKAVITKHDYEIPRFGFAHGARKSGGVR